MNTVLDRQEQYLDEIKSLTLFDDDFMSKVFEDQDCVNELMSAFFPHIKAIVECRGQHKINNLQGRSIILDIYIIDADDRHFDIEVQRANSGAIPQRARFHISLMNGNIIFKSEAFKALPKVCVIFICEHDVFKKGKPVYHIKRMIKKTGEEFDDGEEMLYINGEYEDTKTREGRMMHDFKCADPNEMYNKVIQKRVRYLKETKEGLEEMSEVFERVREKGKSEGIQIGKVEIAKAMLKDKLPLEDIVRYTGLSLESIQTLSFA